MGPSINCTMYIMIIWFQLMNTRMRSIQVPLCFLCWYLMCFLCWCDNLRRVFGFLRLFWTRIRWGRFARLLTYIETKMTSHRSRASEDRVYLEYWRDTVGQKRCKFRVDRTVGSACQEERDVLNVKVSTFGTVFVQLYPSSIQAAPVLEDVLTVMHRYEYSCYHLK